MHAYTRRGKYNYSERNIVLQSNGSVSCSLEMSCHLGKELILTKSSKNSNSADNIYNKPMNLESIGLPYEHKCSYNFYVWQSGFTTQVPTIEEY